MAEQQTATCPNCSRMLSPEDTIVFGSGRLGHLDCRRPRVLSAEERTLLFIYCRDHQVAECVRCIGKFRLREVASLDLFGIRSHGCPWCHTDLTDSIRAHLYGCATLPVEVRRRAQAAREAARSLVESLQLRGTVDGLERPAEASLHALREITRQALGRGDGARPALLARDLERRVCLVRVVDLKTSARGYTDLQVETALQLSVYSYAVGLSPFANGDDMRLRFDVLTKTKQPELCRYWTTRDRAANVRLFRLVSEVLGAVEAGAFHSIVGWLSRTACCGASAGRGSRELSAGRRRLNARIIGPIRSG